MINVREITVRELLDAKKPSYQRWLNPKNVSSISSSIDKIGYQRLAVLAEIGEEYYLIDGQHMVDKIRNDVSDSRISETDKVHVIMNENMTEESCSDIFQMLNTCGKTLDAYDYTHLYNAISEIKGIEENVYTRINKMVWCNYTKDWLRKGDDGMPFTISVLINCLTGNKYPQYKKGHFMNKAIDMTTIELFDYCVSQYDERFAKIEGFNGGFFTTAFLKWTQNANVYYDLKLRRENLIDVIEYAFRKYSDMNLNKDMGNRILVWAAEFKKESHVKGLISA